MTDPLSSPRLDDPQLAQSFRRRLVRWTLAYWAFAFVFLTIRSVIGGAEYLLIQAALRIPMIAIGLTLCALLSVLLVRIEPLSRPAKFALIAAATLLATAVFSLSAYVIYYRMAALWTPERTLAGELARYAIQFVWLFAAWILIFYYVRFQTLASAPAGGRKFVQELWARQRDGQLRIPVEQIEWIESEGDYARVHSGPRSYLIRSTMRRMEAGLDPGDFVRIHRRVIVARRAVAAVRRRPDGGMTAQLESGASLPVGRNYVARLGLRQAPPSVQ